MDDGYVAINYGLYKGKLSRKFIVRWDFDIKMECSFSDGICMFSCQQTSIQRKDEIQRILNGDKTEACVKVSNRQVALSTFDWCE